MRQRRDYATITGAYWVFTLTDGALRMLVLLFLHELGRTPLEIASLFLAYEAFGVLTNFAGGWIGARFGLKATLTVGLGFQTATCLMLAARADALGVLLVLLAQALCGVAKDLTKMSAKSYIKLVVPAGEAGRLMKWVAILTGSKNALKGVGFFLGGFLLASVGFRGACLAMAGALAFALVASALMLPPAAGKAQSTVGLRSLIARDERIRWLSLARLFLFAARDVWFVLAVPIFLTTSLEWSHTEVGAFMALWVIGYGIVQASAPAHMARGSGPGAEPPGALRLAWVSVSLLLPLVGLFAALELGAPGGVSLIVCLALFGIQFAAGSAIHSFLIVAWARDERIALDVGFYYMANAAGRLLGTLLSGALFQAAGEGQAGLALCILGACVLVLLSTLACIPLRGAEERNRAEEARSRGE